MRWLVRGIQVCLLIVFILDAVIPLVGIGAMALRSSYVSDFAPSALALIQTRLGVAGAVAHFFAAFRYLALVVVMEVLWTFYLRAQAIIASYNVPVTPEDY